MTTLGILRKLADISGQELCDNDGEYLFPNGGLIKISSLDRYAKEEWARYCEIVQHNKDLAEHNKIHLIRALAE